MMGMKYVYSQRALHVVVSAFLLSLIMQNDKGAQNIVFFIQIFRLFIFGNYYTHNTHITINLSQNCYINHLACVTIYTFTSKVL